jgi:hypothetical protein
MIAKSKQALQNHVKSQFKLLGHSAVNGGMALCAQRDEVVLGILTGATTKPLVMDFQVRHRAARLAPPTVAA